MKKNNLQLLILSIVAIMGLAFLVHLAIGFGFTMFTDQTGNTYTLPNVTK